MPNLFRNNILGFIPDVDWLSVGFDVRRPNDPVDALFGDNRTGNLVAEWQSIAAEYKNPVMAQFHAFDTEAQKTFRIPVDTHSVEKGLIKVKINQSEALRQFNPDRTKTDQQIYDYVMNDGLRLAEQIVTRTKVAKNELLATGKVTIKENDLDLTVDYGVPAANLQKTLDFGPGAAKDIPTQLQELVDEATEKGIMLTGMVLPRAIMTKLRQNSAVQKAVNGTLGEGALVRNADIRDYLETEYGINNVITNDLVYSVFDGFDTAGRPKVIKQRYFPANKVSFFGVNNAGRIGVGLWGDPPEMDVPGAFTSAGASGESPYVYITQWAEQDPAVLWTKASALFMPVIYEPEALYVASVIETPPSA